MSPQWNHILHKLGELTILKNSLKDSLAKWEIPDLPVSSVCFFFIKFASTRKHSKYTGFSSAFP